MPIVVFYEVAVAAELLQLRSPAMLDRQLRSTSVAVVGASDKPGVSRVLPAEPSLAELDLNPVVLHPKGQGVVALDALMVVR